MSSKITEMVSRCSTCLEFRRKQHREPTQRLRPMAQVIKQADTPRSYIMQDETGRMLRRNRRNLLFTDEKLIIQSPQDLGDDEAKVVEPGTSDTQSITIVQEPTTSFSIPSTSGTQSTTIVQEPTTCSSIPSTSGTQSSTIVQEPTTCSSIPSTNQNSPYKTRYGRIVRHLPGLRIMNVKL